MRGEERAKAKGLHGRGRAAEAVFMVGKGMGRARVRAASTNNTQIKGKILFAFPDGNSDDKIIHSIVLLRASADRARFSSYKGRGSHVTSLRWQGPMSRHCEAVVPTHNCRILESCLNQKGFLFLILNLRNHSRKLKHLFLASETSVYLYKTH